jgi:hypothetical protein
VPDAICGRAYGLGSCAGEDDVGMKEGKKSTEVGTTSRSAARASPSGVYSIEILNVRNARGVGITLRYHRALLDWRRDIAYCVV